MGNSKITDSLRNRKLLFINNSPILLRQLEKNLCNQPPTPSEIALFWTLPPLGISVALRQKAVGGGVVVGGMDIFWNYTFCNPLQL